MITTINEFKKSINEENKGILIPRNLEGRMTKIYQSNYKLLQQETIEGNLTIDDSFKLIKTQSDIKCKQINGNVTIKLNFIPEWLKNITINGNFNCSYNKLTSLEGCPSTINGHFDCSDNNLTSLEGCPSTVNGYFDCSSNKLTSLQECPSTVNGYFNCYNNNLTSLEGCPSTVNGNFSCHNNELTSLKGCPSTVNGDFWCSYNKLTSLEGCPSTINGYFDCSDNKTKFTRDDVKKLSKVKGQIIV